MLPESFVFMLIVSLVKLPTSDLNARKLASFQPVEVQFGCSLSLSVSFKRISLNVNLSSDNDSEREMMKSSRSVSPPSNFSSRSFVSSYSGLKRIRYQIAYLNP